MSSRATGSTTRGRGRTARQPMPDAVLDAAAAEFNARGIAGAVLGKISKQVGLTRAALYYYFDGREDLAFQCFMRSCATAAEDIRTADAAQYNGLDKLQAFIRRALDPQRPPAVVLSEVAYLDEDRRRQVEAAHRRNVSALRGFIERGMADGSMRDCDADVVCQAVIGMLSWVPLSEMWSSSIRAGASDALTALVEHGIAADRKAVFRCPLDIAAFMPAAGNAFDRTDTKAMKVEQIARAASQLFNQRGIDGTSLDDITATLGATKGAFYHYIEDKPALVTICYERAYALYERFIDAAENAGADGRERAFIGLHLNVQAQVSQLAPLSPLTGIEALPARVRNRLKKLSWAIEQRYEGFGEAGIADGSLRLYPVTVIATAGAGAFGWIPKWLPADDPRGPRRIADEICALFAIGLRSVP